MIVAEVVRRVVLDGRESIDELFRLPTANDLRTDFTRRLGQGDLASSACGHGDHECERCQHRAETTLNIGSQNGTFLRSVEL
ncbi:hypothetical protein [Lentzea sp. NPDC059081]|uniref:hypothetical protein n=1 Tax=Lentzea sp. NPDC059081 TaxID=3346719 RepID=UPI00367D1800